MMAAPYRVRLSRKKGWRIPPDTVSVARPGKWGNPYIVGKDGTRAQCAGLYYTLLGGFIDFSGKLTVDEQLAIWRRGQRSLADLKGKNVACWCSLDGPCHGDILLALANGTPAPAWAQEGVTLPRVRLGMRAPDVERELRKKRARDRDAAPRKAAGFEAEGQQEIACD